MVHTSSAAGSTAAVFASASTTTPPAMLRTINTSRPTITKISRSRAGSRGGGRRRGTGRARRAPRPSTSSTITRPSIRSAASWASVELIRAQHRELARVRGQLLRQVAPRPTRWPTCSTSRSEVEGHLAAGGRHGGATLVLDDLHELLVRRAVEVLPGRLHAGALERAPRNAFGELAQPPGDGPGQALRLRRQCCPDLALHVHVRIQLVHEVDRERVPDLLALEQLRAGLGPLVGVQGLPVDPAGNHEEERDHRGRDQQHGDAAPARRPPARIRRGGGLSGAHRTVATLTGREAAEHPSCERPMDACRHHPNRMKSWPEDTGSVPATLSCSGRPIRHLPTRASAGARA